MKSNSQNSRPKNLDKRVFFCKDFPGTKILHKNDALYLHIEYHNQYKQFKWMLEFDLLESGSSGFVFTEDEFKRAIQICESEPFDFKLRQQRGLNDYPTSLILYRYSELKDVVKVANKIADFSYSLHNNQERRLLYNEINAQQYRKTSSDPELYMYIQDQRNGEFRLFLSRGLELDFLLFENGNFFIKKSASSFIIEDKYSYEQAIDFYNPDQKDGVLLINHKLKKAEFYSTDWNTFCLGMDRRTFTQKGEPISITIIQPEEPFFEKVNHHESEENNRNTLKLDELFVDNTNEIKELLNDDINEVEEVETNIRFREGATSQTVINSYERNPQARKKCLEYYGTSCFVCEFDFGKTFGKIGEGFIHVHHLKPISEIREEYEINPIEDMRPVCPNCHAIIHRRDPVFSIEEMKTLLQSPK